MIECIYTKDGEPWVEFGYERIYSTAKHEESLMGDNHITLEWRDVERIYMPAFTYILVSGIKYMLLDDYEPTIVSEGEWQYAPVFRHQSQILSKIPFTLNTLDAFGNEINEVTWEYTGNATTLLGKVVNLINDLDASFGLGKGWTFATIGAIKDSATCSFDSQDILSALTTASNQFECEWHIDPASKTIYFGKIAIGTLPLVVANGIHVCNPNKDTKHNTFNAYLAKGSTRNVSQQTPQGGNVTASTRLTLNPDDYPDGVMYVDDRGNRMTKEQFDALGIAPLTKVVNFDDVYPHVDLYVYGVKQRTRTLYDSETKEPVISGFDVDTGAPIYKQYTIWYCRLAYPVTANGKTTWHDYEVKREQILNGFKLMLSYGANEAQGALTSPLAGREFEMIYHDTANSIAGHGKDGDADYDSGVEVAAGDYEFVYTEENDIIIPTTQGLGLIPIGEETPSLKGNKVILFNIAMGEDEVASAQAELAEKTLQYIAEEAKEQGEITLQSIAHHEQTSPVNYSIGRKIFYSSGYGNVLYRVTKLTTDIDQPYLKTITIANNLVKGSVTTLKEDVKTLMASGAVVGGEFEGAFNALQVKKSYLSKLQADTAKGEINFEKGLSAEDYYRGNGALLKDGALEVVLTRPQKDRIFFPRVEEHFAEITGKEEHQLRGLFVYNAGQNGGKTDIHVKTGTSGNVVVKEVNVLITSLLGDDLKTEVNDTFENRHLDDDFSVNLRKANGDVLYEIVVTYTIENRGEVTGSINTYIGNKEDYLVAQLYDSQRIAKCNISPNNFSLLQFDGDLGELAGGINITPKGIQIYDSNPGFKVWRRVELKLE